MLSVLTRREIEARGYHSIAEALRVLVGFFVAEAPILASVNVRGINAGFRGDSSIIKVMINGHPTAFRPDISNFLGREQIPITMVDRIEVIRGPASALYGANAFLGVVNIVTSRSEAAEGQWRAAASYRNLKGFGAGGQATFGYRGGRLRINAGASGDYLDDSGLSVRTTLAEQIVGPQQPLTSRNDFKVPKSFYAELELDAGSAGRFFLDGNLQHLIAAAKLAIRWLPTAQPAFLI